MYVVGFISLGASDHSKSCDFNGVGGGVGGGGLFMVETACCDSSCAVLTSSAAQYCGTGQPKVHNPFTFYYCYLLYYIDSVVFRAAAISRCNCLCQHHKFIEVKIDASTSRVVVMVIC